MPPPAHHRRTVTTGERGLYEAALAQGILDAMGKVFCPDQPPREITRMAQQWMRSDDTSWPFSFCSLCDMLGLDPAHLRASVYRRNRSRLAVAA